jgi:tetratricopeptide (TPR) repeat protein
MSCLSKKKNFLELSQSANLSLAELLRGRGDFDRALPIYEACLEERQRYLGVDHPHTLLLVSAVAFTLHLKGDHARALPLFDRCLSSWIATLGEDHANTVLCQTRRDACAVRLPPPASPLLRPPASPLLSPLPLQSEYAPE